MDIVEFSNFIKESAKEILVKDGHLDQMVFFVSDKKRFFMSIELDKLYPAKSLSERLSEDELKHRQYMVAAVIAKKIEAEIVVLLSEAAFKEFDNGVVDATETPLAYPKSMRTECIFIDAVDIKEKKECVEVVPFKGGEKEKVEFIDIENLKTFFDEGDNQSLFFSCITGCPDEFYEKVKNKIYFGVMKYKLPEN